MARVFADAAYWIAVLNPLDQLHQKAMKIGLTFQPDQMVTSEMVLTEVLNTLGKSGPHQRSAAAQAVASLREQAEIKIYAQTSELFGSALQLYRKRPDKSWSLTDCASFIIMEEQQLSAALTQDHHFVQAGFDALLR